MGRPAKKEGSKTGAHLLVDPEWLGVVAGYRPGKTSPSGGAAPVRLQPTPSAAGHATGVCLGTLPPFAEPEAPRVLS